MERDGGEERAFQASKQWLFTSDVLVHYDPKLELVLLCDASCYGVRAVLSHQMAQKDWLGLPHEH